MANIVLRQSIWRPRFSESGKTESESRGRRKKTMNRQIGIPNDKMNNFRIILSSFQ